MTVHGPYDTADQARADITNPAGPENQAWRRTALNRAHANNGVGLGEHDRVIAGWLSGWELDTVQTVIGWIERAYAAGLATGARHAAPIEMDFDDIRDRITNGGGPR